MSFCLAIIDTVPAKQIQPFSISRITLMRKRFERIVYTVYTMIEESKLINTNNKNGIVCIFALDLLNFKNQFEVRG